MNLLLIAGLLFASMSTAADTPPLAVQQPDTRLQRQHDSPPWLFSIGQLHIPTKKWIDNDFQHGRETCSASLTGPDNAEQSDRILTAWHCLEYYNDLSRPIKFVLQDRHGQSIMRLARMVASGGGMHSDWAVLTLQDPIDISSELLPQMTEEGGKLILSPDSEITLAGFSADSELGEHGKRLTFQSRCAVTSEVEGDIALNCIAHKGASGGPALVRVVRGEKDQIYLAGVISRGNGADTSIVVGSESFISALRVAYQ